jgi:glycosyltransferase involved in cell wall biosynthesis
MDNYGGAARIAWDLHTAYRKMGHHSRMFVGKKFGDDADVDLVPDAYPSSAWELFRQLLKKIKSYDVESSNKILGWFARRLSKNDPIRLWNNYWCLEDFDYPGTWKLLDIAREQKSDIVHLHNLHANYFDLRILPSLSARHLVVMTLHDAWLLSGHCAHSLDCERWKIGCGSCPYLNISPPMLRDSTACYWRRKRNIYSKSQVYVVSPSQWLIDKAKDVNSILRPAAVNFRVIPNGVDLSIFHPASKSQVRQELGILKDAFVLLFVAAGSKDNLSINLYKDYATIHAALEIVARQTLGKEVVFLAVGGSDDEKVCIGNMLIKFLPYVSNPVEIAKYYQAADAYLHAAHAETFPTVILESLACGTPVIATAVGGIPEQVTDNLNGFLVKKFDASAMAARILEIFNNSELRGQLAEQSAMTAKKLWGLDRMVKNYLSYYQEINTNWKSRHAFTR